MSLWGLIPEPVVCVVLFFHRTSGDVVSGEPGLCQVEHFLLVGLFGFVCFFLLVVVVSGCFRTGWFWWGLPLLNCLEASGTLSECLFFSVYIHWVGGVSLSCDPVLSSGSCQIGRLVADGKSTPHDATYRLDPLARGVD